MLKKRISVTDAASARGPNRHRINVVIGFDQHPQYA
jgi:hypothetical protein